MTRFRIVRAAIMADATLPRAALAIVGCVGGAAALRWLFGAAAEPVPFVTFFPAIVLCTLLAGWQAGLASILASATVVNLIFAQNPLQQTGDPRTLGMTALFGLSCILLVAIGQTVRRTFRQSVEANHRAEALNQELRHRIRNTLAVVQAIARISHRADPEHFHLALSKRLSALAAAHDVLWEGGGDGCQLRAVVTQACQPFLHDDCLTFTGPDCTLPADACVPLSLALHELCTNALKHGALSTPGGKVAVSWATPQEGKTTLLWHESGGPPVSPPTRRGLGTVLLEGGGQIGAAELRFHAEGLECEIPLTVVDPA